MSSKLLIMLFVSCVHLAAFKPVRKTLNFNMFVLKPQPNAPDRLLVTTNGISRFGPILEYLVQRVQGLLSVRVPHDQQNTISIPNQQIVSQNRESNQEMMTDAEENENEVDSVYETTSRLPGGVVVRPSRTRPGTYELEIDVVMDDEYPDLKKRSHN